jgi:hypothetical protein
MIVKTFTEPTDIVLIGESEIRLNEKGETEWHGDFLITDDECAITLMFGEKKFNIDTLGFFNVFTMEQFNEQREYIQEEFTFNFLFLPQFVGDIQMNVVYTRKEHVQGEGRKIVETHTVSEFPDENEYVMYVDRPGKDDDEFCDQDWDCNVVVNIEPTKTIVITQNEDGELDFSKIDNYVHEEWDQTLFNGSNRFQNTQMGHGFLVFKDDTQKSGKRKDVIKGITHEITRNLGKYLNAEAIKFMPYHQDEELDKLINSMESGPFEAQLK